MAFSPAQGTRGKVISQQKVTGHRGLPWRPLITIIVLAVAVFAGWQLWSANDDPTAEASPTTAPGSAAVFDDVAGRFNSAAASRTSVRIRISEVFPEEWSVLDTTLTALGFAPGLAAQIQATPAGARGPSAKTTTYTLGSSHTVRSSVVIEIKGR